MASVEKNIQIWLTEMEGALIHELISKSTPKKEMKRLSGDEFNILVLVMQELEENHITYDEYFNQPGEPS